jgi:hypothetical protein
VVEGSDIEVDDHRSVIARALALARVPVDVAVPHAIGEGEWADTSMVANDVTVKFKLALSGMAPL